MSNPMVNGELFAREGQSSALPIRVFDPSSAEGELRLHLQGVERSVARLDEAQNVPRELLEKVMSI